jgi:hypothetical protein
MDYVEKRKTDKIQSGLRYINTATPYVFSTVVTRVRVAARVLRSEIRDASAFFGTQYRSSHTVL